MIKSSLCNFINNGRVVSGEKYVSACRNVGVILNQLCSSLKVLNDGVQSVHVNESDVLNRDIEIRNTKRDSEKEPSSPSSYVRHLFEFVAVAHVNAYGILRRWMRRRVPTLRRRISLRKEVRR